VTFGSVLSLASSDTTAAPTPARPSPPPPSAEAPAVFERPEMTQAGFLPMDDLLDQLKLAAPEAAADVEAPPREQATPPEPPADAESFGDLLLKLKSLPKAKEYTPLRGRCGLELDSSEPLAQAAEELAAPAPRSQRSPEPATTPSPELQDAPPTWSSPVLTQQQQPPSPSLRTLEATLYRGAASAASPLSSLGYEIIEATPSPCSALRPADGGRLQSTQPMSPPAAWAPAGKRDGEGGACQRSDAAARGVFHGMAAVLDPDLEPEEREAVEAAVGRGGGSVCQSARLGRGVTHAVCRPDASLRWMRLGLNIATPEWVLQSLKAGRLQRCISLSADAARHLPGALAAEAGADPAARDAPSGAEGRARAVAALDEELAARDGGALQAACAPPQLLEGVSWTVSEAPARARMEREPQDMDVIPDSDGEEAAPPPPPCFTATQAVVQEVLWGCEPSLGSQGGAETGAGDARLQAVCFRGAAMLVLLPADASGALGHDARTLHFPPSRHATVADILEAVYQHYQEELGAEEQLALLRRHCGGGGGGAARGALRAAFVAGRTLRRHELLGARRSLEGLVKATRDPTTQVYELRLCG
jgi:hypothetical protein